MKLMVAVGVLIIFLPSWLFIPGTACPALRSSLFPL
jgi:hypothetical protein